LRRAGNYAKLLPREMATPSPWRFGFFYFNRDDPRLLVPKRSPGLGWTINCAQPRAWLVLVAITLAASVICVALSIWIHK